MTGIAGVNRRAVVKPPRLAPSATFEVHDDGTNAIVLRPEIDCACRALRGSSRGIFVMRGLRPCDPRRGTWRLHHQLTTSEDIRVSRPSRRPIRRSGRPMRGRRRCIRTSSTPTSWHRSTFDHVLTKLSMIATDQNAVGNLSLILLELLIPSRKQAHADELDVFHSQINSRRAGHSQPAVARL